MTVWHAPALARYLTNCLILALAVALLAGPAAAFTPHVAPVPLVGAQPSVAVTMTHSTVDGRDPKQGESFTYTADFTFRQMVEVGVRRTIVLTVSANPNAPFATAVTAADFRYADGRSPQATALDCRESSCTITYQDLPDGVLTFTKAATVAASLGPAEVVAGAASARITSVGSIALAHQSQSFVPDSGPVPCGGTATWQIAVPQAGGWLADLKFADVYATGKVTFDDAPLVNGRSQPTSKNSLIVTAADGSDLTEAVLSSASFNPADPSKPFLGKDEISTTHPNARWLQSVNWPFDISNYTGVAWIPSGATITVTKHLTFYDCAIGGFPSPADFFASRWKAGIALQIGRPETKVSAQAQTYFVTPGVAVPASCVNQLYASQEPTAPRVFNDYYQIANGRTTSLGPNPSTTRTVAATDRHPQYIFSIVPVPESGGPTTLMVYDTGTKAHRMLSVGTTSFGNALGFDKHGYLWLIDLTGRVHYLTERDIDTLLDGGTADWQTRGTLQSTRPSVLAPAQTNAFDIAFDGTDTAYLVRPNNIYRVSRDELLNNTGTVPMVNPLAISVSWPNGMAFLGDDLLIGYGWRNGSSGSGNQVRTIVKIDRNTGTSTDVTSQLGYTGLNISDLGSCSFPGDSGATPGYRVQKSVIDPVTAAVTPAGNASVNKVPIADDGSVVIDFLITVTLTGNVPGTHPAINDMVHLPAGFQLTDVLLDGVSKGASGQYTIPGARLDPSAAASTAKFYRVQVKATAPALTAVDWAKAAVCDNAGAGNAAAGGFFNAVTMSHDGDGPENNDACVPAEPRGKAKLTLIKRIVDANGADLPAFAADAQYFTLLAGGPTPLSGHSARSGQVAASGVVSAGTYRLSEQAADGGAHTGKYAFGSWSCDSGKVPDAANQITVVNGDDVTCTITNSPRPTVHIVKTATSPAADNPHSGAAVTPAADGSVLLRYTMTLTSTASFTGHTGAVSDTFVVPAGLVWDGDKPAVVTFNAQGTGASVADLRTSVSQAELREMVRLASAVRDLPAGQSVTFAIEIPLRIDSTPAGSGTVFDQHVARLSSCADLVSAQGHRYSDASRGIPNVVTLVGEDLTYNDIPRQDNLACIPVAPPGAVAVSKWANPEATSHVGGSPVAFDGSNQATVRYWISLRNTGPNTYTTGPVTDLPQVPAGTQLVGPIELTYTLNGNTGRADGTALSTGQVRSVPAQGGSVPVGEQFTLAPAASGSPVLVEVAYRLELTGDQAQRQRTELAIGSCQSAADGTVPNSSGGLLNRVTLTKDTDSDGEPNNQACHPVLPRIQVVKYGQNCDVGVATCQLPGARFALYPDNGHGTGPAADPIADGLAPAADGAAVFNSIGLTRGVRYWLVETAAPAGHVLLAQPVGFTLGDQGIEIVAGSSPAVVRDAALLLTVNVTDTTAGDLPMTGGAGPLPIAALALFLMALGVGGALRTRRPSGGGEIA